MLRYGLIICWSKEDEAFIAEVPGLPGCKAHGSSQRGALDNAQEAIELWLDTAREFGDPVPVPKGRWLSMPEPGNLTFVTEPANGRKALAEKLVGRPGATTPWPEKLEEQQEAEEELLQRLVDLNHQHRRLTRHSQANLNSKRKAPNPEPLTEL